MVSIAMDAQGAEVARPWYDTAHATFPTLVDSENVVGRLYGLKAIPYVLLVNEQGQLVLGPVSGNIDNDEFQQMLVRWITDPAYEKELLQQRKPVSAEKERSPEQMEADLRFRLGRVLLQQDRRDEAMQEWRKALSLDPGNWIIHKQIWAVENPDRFYDGSVDYQWQKQQLEAEKTQ